MSAIKSKEDIQRIREGGRRLARVMDALESMVTPGVTTKEIDTLAEKLIREGGDEPAFLGYQPGGATFPYPATVCTSVNDQVVHGIPGERVLVEGDIIGLDIGLAHEGLIVDMARTIPVGKISPEVAKLLVITQGALKAGIAAASPGGRVGDISAAIEAYGSRENYGIVRELGGHGVGHAVHELPFVPNYGKAGTGPLLKENMVLALEPMFNLGGDGVMLERDGYTYATQDGLPSAHFEHTIVITKKGADIVTVS